MSFAGHVDCQRMLIGPVWPLAIMGKPSVAAPAVAAAAPVRNLRRAPASGFLDCSLLIRSSYGKTIGFSLGVGPRRSPGNKSDGGGVPVSLHRSSSCSNAKARESYAYTGLKSSRVPRAFRIVKLRPRGASPIFRDLPEPLPQ